MMISFNRPNGYLADLVIIYGLYLFVRRSIDGLPSIT
jgi:hypothetical protein